MKKIIVTVSLILVFLTGLSVLLYPYVSSHINSLRQSRVVAQYYRDLDTLTEEDFTALFAAAFAYNAGLQSKPDRFVMTNKELEAYLGLLNPFGNGIMGTLIIDKIGVDLPIYHETSNSILQVGAGHFEGTSLPVGGEGTHTVITGHRGLPSSTLFARLDELEVGDRFTLKILNETLTYEVDRILVVEPHELDYLAIDGKMDYCTLLTCTPYGINSHRLLVRGFRVENAPDQAARDSNRSSADVAPDGVLMDEISVAAMILSPVVLIVIISAAFRIKRVVSGEKKRDRI